MLATRSICVSLFALSIVLAACSGDSERNGDGSGGNPQAAAAVNHAQQCGLITPGQVSLGPAEDNGCIASCMVSASCDDLRAVLCQDAIPSQELQNCAAACDDNGGTFDCADGNGDIPADWVCDGDEDCSDASDEANCAGQVFTCTNGGTVPLDWQCDGEDDCGDGSDEAGCPPVAMFTCGDGEQIPAWQQCDFDEDCEDGSDEAAPCASVTCE